MRLTLIAFALCLASCTWNSAERRATLGADLIACGISTGLGELSTLNTQAQVALSDWKISDAEALAALNALEATAKTGLLACLAQLTVDAFKTMPAPLVPTQPLLLRAAYYAGAGTALEPPEQRARRRAASWLALRGGVK